MKEKEDEMMKGVKLDSGRLAGWGSWAGPDIKQKQIDPEELKRKRLQKLVLLFPFIIFACSKNKSRNVRMEQWTISLLMSKEIKDLLSIW